MKKSRRSCLARHVCTAVYSFLLLSLLVFISYALDGDDSQRLITRLSDTPDADAKETDNPLANRLVAAAIERTRHQVAYDPAYVRIDYPGGDVPPDQGVCSDVVIRAYRAVGIDLQKEIHEDISEHFDQYPSRRIWGLQRPDPNIDHRRVPNLMCFFKRHDAAVPVTDRPEDYLPGDVVAWQLGSGKHIGIVTDKKTRDGKTPLVVHNAGWGPVLENFLFSFPVIGHYRYPASPQLDLPPLAGN